jgi:hypothetical protein
VSLWPFYEYFKADSAFFDNKIQRLFKKEFPEPNDDPRPIAIFLMAEYTMIEAFETFDDSSHFLKTPRRQFGAKLLLELARFYDDPKRPNLDEEYSLETRAVRYEAAELRRARVIKNCQPKCLLPKKWDEVAYDYYGPGKARGDRLKTYFDRGVKKRRRIIERWRPNIEAWIDSRHRNGS